MKTERLKTVRLGGVAFCLFLSATLLAQDLEITAYVNRTPIPLNDQFELNIELSGSDANRVQQPDVPDLSAFATYVGSSSSSNIQIINGQMNVTKIFTHHYISKKAGKFIIPAVKIVFKNKTFASKPIAVEVVKKKAASKPQPKGTPNRRRNPGNEELSDLLFLRAHVNKKRVYQNEPVIVTYKIYTAVNVTNYGVTQLPNTVGFWSEEFQQPARLRLTTEVLNGRQYRVAEIKRYALFPQGPGQKTLDPMVVDCEVQLPRRRTSRDIFDDFFNDSFFSRTVRRSIASNEIAIDVLPLPADARPRNFSGLVGRFAISASVDKQKVKTNEAVTLNVNISGTGNIKIIPQPDIQFPADFEVYDPKVHEDIRRGANSISGSKTFEYVMIPRFAGKQLLKPIELSYFDLKTKSYKVLKTQPIEIDVARGDDSFSGVGVVNSKEDVKFIGKDIRFIQTRLPEFQRIGVAFYKKPYFYLFFILPALAYLGAVGYRRHLDKMSSNVAYARSRKANQMALKRLKTAQKAMTSGAGSSFYSEVSRALLGYVADKLNMSPAGIIIEDVEQQMQKKGLQPESIQRFVDCVKACDFNRFAPGQSDASKMAEFFEEAKQVIVDLDKQF